MIDKYDLYTSDSDLPISEEMLGAYLEGNLSDEEFSTIHQAINNDLGLMNLTYELQRSPIAQTDFFDDLVIDNIEIPVIIDEIPSESTIVSDYPNSDDDSFEFPEIESDDFEENHDSNSEDYNNSDF